MKHAVQKKICPRCGRKYRGFSRASMHDPEVMICIRCAKEELWVQSQIMKITNMNVKTELIKEETEWLNQL